MRSPVIRQLAASSLVVALTLVSGRTRPALGYVPSITNETQTPLSWRNSNCVYIRPNKAGSADIKDGSDLAAIDKAIAEWRNKTKACSYFRVELLEPTSDAKFEFDEFGYNENAIVWVEKDWEHDRQAAGITTVFFIDKEGSGQDGRILDADVEINGEFFRYSTNGSKDRTDVQNTVTHELGHVFGLDHPCDDGTRSPVPKDHEGNTIPKCFPPLKLPKELREVTMYNFAEPGETLKRTVEDDDVLGICETYPKADDPGECRAVDLTGGNGGCALPSPPANTSPLFWLGLLGLLGLLARSQRSR